MPARFLILLTLILTLAACARPDPTPAPSPTHTPTVHPTDAPTAAPLMPSPTPLIIDTSRAVEVVPRNFDLWAINPDGTVRFATLYYPDDSIEEERRTEVVNVSGVLVRSGNDVVESSVIGGADPAIDIMPGISRDDYFVYPLASFVRDRNGQPYGFDVLSSRSPYVTMPITPGDSDASVLPSVAQEFSISVGVADSLQLQVIVAVALPAGTRIVAMCQPVSDDTCPYRTITLNGWTIYYFDTTYTAFYDVLRMTFLPNPTNQPILDDLDVLEVDAQR